MAFVRKNWVGSSLDDAAIEMPKTTSAAVTKGNVAAWARSSNWLVEAGGSTDNHGSNCYFGVFKDTAAAAISVVNAVPFQHNQIWEVDCANNTAGGQIGQRCNLSAAGTLDNDGTDGTSASDIFEIVKNIGSASDKKALVRVLAPVGQATA